MSEPTKSKVHLPLPDEGKCWWWLQSGKKDQLCFVKYKTNRGEWLYRDENGRTLIAYKLGGYYWTKAEISDPPPIPPKPQLPRLFRWKGQYGVLMPGKPSETIVLHDEDETSQKTMKLHADGIEWIDGEDS